MGKCCLCCADLARMLKRSFVRATWEIRTCDRVTGPGWGGCRKRGRNTESVVETVGLPRYLLVCVCRVCFITRFLFSTNCSTQTSTHNINLVLLLLMNYVVSTFQRFFWHEGCSAVASRWFCWSGWHPDVARMKP